MFKTERQGQGEGEADDVQSVRWPHCFIFPSAAWNWTTAAATRSAAGCGSDEVGCVVGRAPTGPQPALVDSSTRSSALLFVAQSVDLGSGCSGIQFDWKIRPNLVSRVESHSRFFSHDKNAERRGTMNIIDIRERIYWPLIGCFVINALWKVGKRLLSFKHTAWKKKGFSQLIPPIRYWSSCWPNDE